MQLQRRLASAHVTTDMTAPVCLPANFLTMYSFLFGGTATRMSPALHLFFTVTTFKPTLVSKHHLGVESFASSYRRSRQQTRAPDRRSPLPDAAQKVSRLDPHTCKFRGTFSSQLNLRSLDHDALCQCCAARRNTGVAADPWGWHAFEAVPRGKGQLGNAAGGISG